MKTSKTKRVWRELLVARPGTQRRFDGHPLRLHYGTDELSRPMMLLRLDERPEAVRLGDAVEVGIGHRAVWNEWAMVLTLQDSSLTDTFIDLCIDLAERSSVGEDEQKALVLFHRALENFRDLLLGGGKSGPSVEELRGMVAELWFAMNVVSLQLDPPRTLTAWTGPLGAAHDFRLPGGDLIEVKSLHAEARTIRISSAEQLDPVEPSPLALVTIAIEDCAAEADGAVCLPDLVDAFKLELATFPDEREGLELRLKALGVASTYKDITRPFAVVGMRHYRVQSGFPRILRKDIALGIENVRYQLRVMAIEAFEMTDHRWPKAE